MKNIENKDIHISFIKEVMMTCGYDNSEVENISAEHITLETLGNQRYIVIKYPSLDEFALSLEEYIKYSDWWTAIKD